MYKTILLHCDDKHRIKTLLAPALFIADHFEAHLIALSVVPPGGATRHVLSHTTLPVLMSH